MGVVVRTVELFAGIGGFRIAADGAGYKSVWANDIDPLACSVYADRFGEGQIIQGDIAELLDSVPRHDLLTGGFPCQPFSSAGKKRGIEDPRGTLFSQIVALLEKRKPKYFILENVKRLLTMDRGMHFATILASLSELAYEVEWRLVNVAHLGLPQNRQRVIIIGARRDGSSKRGGGRSRGTPVRLASAGDLATSPHLRTSELANWTEWSEIEAHGSRFPNWGVAWRGKFYAANLHGFEGAKPPIALSTVLESEVGDEFDFTESTVDRIKESASVRKLVQGVEVLSNQSGGARMGYTVFGIGGLAPTLTASTSRHYERYMMGDRYRRLTNVESARIQGFSDDHCSAASVYKQYKLYGNAIPPQLASWAIRRTLASPLVVDASCSPAPQRELFA
jgi:DNA (cytosine-5)-methyltransferase 1